MKEMLKNLDNLMMAACFSIAAIIFIFFPFSLAMLLGWWPVLALLNIMAKHNLEKEVESLGKKLKCAEERSAKREQMISTLQGQIDEEQKALADLKKQLEKKPKPRARKPKAKKEKPMSFVEICKRSEGGLQTFK